MRSLLFHCQLLVVLMLLLEVTETLQFRPACMEKIFTECQICIQADPRCQWCLDEGFEHTRRCAVEQELGKNGCQDVYSPENNFTVYGVPSGASTVVTTPTIEVWLRLGESLTVPLTYGPVQGDPESRVKVRPHDTAPDWLMTVYYSTCSGNRGRRRRRQKCRVTPGNKVTYELVMSMTECPLEEVSEFAVLEPNYGDTVVRVHALCQCDCEKSSNHTSVTSQCNDAGHLQCGQCVCDSGFFGRSCECQFDAGGPDSCRRRSDDPTVCSGRGDCVCGICECWRRPNSSERIYGQFCECDDFSCDRYEGLLCGGVEHGQCVCGECMCRPDWIGSACSCSTNTHGCRKNEGDQLCSGHGICDCGQCHCDEPYSGQYCEYNPTSPGMCVQLKTCVEATLGEVGNCGDVTAVLVDDFPNDDADARLCYFIRSSDSCSFQFYYRTNQPDIVYVIRNLSCPTPAAGSSSTMSAAERITRMFLIG